MTIINASPINATLSLDFSDPEGQNEGASRLFIEYEPSDPEEDYLVLEEREPEEELLETGASKT